MSARVELSAYDPRWANEFDDIERQIARAFEHYPVSIFHIGSTSIPAVGWAKPVIDVLLTVPDLAHVDRCAPGLAAAGFEGRGEYGIAGRRYFVRKAVADRPGVHLHAFVASSIHVTRHLAFRDYLRAHPDEARAYGDLKLRLVAETGADKGAYQAGKADFIAEIERRALGLNRAITAG